MVIRRLVLISITIILGVTCLFLVVSAYDNFKVASINREYKTDLVTYDLSKNLSSEAIRLLSVSSQESYTKLREEAKTFMTESLWVEYFKSEEYIGGEKPFTVNIDDVTGEILDSNHFIFKYELSISLGGVERETVLLVYVKNNLIYRVQSMG